MKTERPLVSVVIPVYNGERYVRSCIENILGQSYKIFEIIVVDDGSTDGSADIIEQYPVKIIRQENKGSSAARNAGLDQATGEFVHFMDVDDNINTAFYEHLVEHIVRYDADIACSGMINQRVPKETHFFKKAQAYTSVHEKLKITYVGRIGFVWRYLFRKRFLKEYNLRFKEGRIVEDLMFSLAAVYFAKKLVVVPEAVYTYIHRKNSQMTLPGKEQQARRHQDWLYAKKYMFDFAKKYDFKIPGVNTGKWGFIWWRYLNKWSNG